MDKLKFKKKELRKFAMILGFAFLVLFFITLLKHKVGFTPFIIISVFIFTLALFIPSFLKPIYFIWMRFAHILGWINTRLLLFIVFFLIFTPIGLIMKLLKIDPLQSRIQKSTSTYWFDKEIKPSAMTDYERQF